MVEVSILVLVDAALRLVYEYTEDGENAVSILVLVDAALRLFLRLPLSDNIPILFQSLF